MNVVSFSRLLHLLYVDSPHSLLIITFRLIGGMGLLFGLFRLILSSMSTHQPPRSYSKDVRFDFDDDNPFHVHLPSGKLPSGSQLRSRNRVRHHQFGIYRRLRWNLGLVPKYHGPVTFKSTWSEAMKKEQRFVEEQKFIEDWMERWQIPEHSLSKLHHVPQNTPYREWSVRSKITGRVESAWHDAKSKHRVPERSLDNLLSKVDPLRTHQAELLLLQLFSPRRNPTRYYKSRLSDAYIAAARLTKELNIRSTTSPQCRMGTYLIDDSPSSHVPIVFDTGCSTSVTPFAEDFVSEIKPADIQDLTGLTDAPKVEGFGYVEWPIRDVFGQVAVIKTSAYYVPEATIRLNSPQTYFQENQGGCCTLDHSQLTFTTAKGNILRFPYHPMSNLPLMYPDQSIGTAGLTAHHVLNLSSDPKLKDRINSLLLEENYNLTQDQKELLLWHYRLCHAGLGWIQDLMKHRKDIVGGDAEEPVILTKGKKTRSCPHPKCAACQLSKQYRKTPDSSTVHANPDREMAIRRGDLQPGDCVSMDQYVCKVPGRLPHTRGKERTENKYSGGTIFIDHASQYVHVKHQVSLRVGETLQGKHKFENFAGEHGVKIKSYHADNHPFAAKEFREDLELQNQTITFSGVGAHHANGISERMIKSLTSWSRALLMQQLIHWPNEFRADLWPFAMNMAVHIWNNLPRAHHGFTPRELFTNERQPITLRYPLQRTKVWGCPVWVLNPKLQDAKRIPKWSKRSRLGMYVGPSLEHSSDVGLVLNLDTGAVSAQYHVVYDETFSTVPGMLTDAVFDEAEWNKLFELGGYENNVNPMLDKDAIPYQDSYDDFISDSDEPDGDDSSSSSSVSRGDGPLLAITADSNDSDSDDNETPDDSLVSEGAKRNIKPVQSQPKKTKSRLLRELADFNNKGKLSVKQGSTRTGRRTRSGRRTYHVQDCAQAYFAKPTTPTSTQTRPQFRVNQYLAGGFGNKKVREATLNSSYLHGLSWSTNLSDYKSMDTKRVMLQMLRHYDYVNGTLGEFHPMALAAAANDADTPNWTQAMNGPHAEGFWEACKLEVKTLEDMDVWDVVDREDWMEVIPVTFAFRIKRFPSGLVRKLKSRLCVRGDREIENVHYWDTYAPVVNWDTVRFLLILSVQLKLETLQVDYTAAFVHADVQKPPGYDAMTTEEQYKASQFAEMPRGFGQPGKVLRLKKNLYGKKSAPRLWFQHLKAKLEAVGFVQQIEVDPCLFISDKVICVCFVDDSLLFARNRSDIDDVIAQLTGPKHNMKLEAEDSVAGFLGVHIDRNEATGEITLTQRGLIDRIIDALQIEGLPAVSTPATGPLGKDEFGDPPNGTFSCPSVIGMLWYLTKHSRPELSFACSQVARYTFNPKRSHELALIRIGQYLKSTRDKGLILKPTDFDKQGFTMDIYVDSDFCGRFGSDEPTNPDNVRSRAGYVICVNNCPITWNSKLMDPICLSTMMAEYYALSMSMREVLPLRDLVRTVGRGIKIDDKVMSTFKVTIWEDNMGALTLANLDPGHNTPRSRHYDSKVHHFRQYLNRESDGPGNQITVESISTERQPADLMTKALDRQTFERLRKLIMGW